MALRIQILAAITALFSTIAKADFTSPIGLSFLTIEEHLYLQFPGPDDNVCGLRLNILRSVNKQVCGVDIGVILNNTLGEFTGLEIGGIMNRVLGRARIFGLQFAGLANSDRQASIFGLQLALLRNHVLDDGTIIGFQVALGANQAPKTDIYGVQFALFNQAHMVTGLQIGLLNIAESLRGVQIGLLNFNHSGIIGFFPGLNIGF